MKIFVSHFQINAFYFTVAIATFYFSFDKAREKGTLINIGE